MNWLEKVVFKRVELWLVLVILIVALPLAGMWGVSTVLWKVFPYSVILEVQAFLKGHPSDKRPITQRANLLYNYKRFCRTPMTPTPLPAGRQLTGVSVNEALDKSELPLTNEMKFFSTLSQDDLFLIYGDFSFVKQKVNWGAVLIDGHGVLQRAWPIKPSDYEFQGAHIGMAVTDQGDIVSNTNGRLMSTSWCGGTRWEAEWRRPVLGVDDIEGNDWHHDVTVAGDKIYTFRGPSILTVNALDGKIENELHVLDLIRWARADDLSIFDARRERFTPDAELTPKNLVEDFPNEPFHLNKVDVLSEKLARFFPEFKAGDLLVSMRALNLVFVVRPSAKKIIWYRYGLTQGQHDATFQNGFISVFDNYRSSKPHRPRIVQLDINKNKRETLFELSKWGLSMPELGNFVLTPSELLVNDFDNGRVILGDLNGNVKFLFENGIDKEENLVLPIQDMVRLTREQVSRFDRRCGAK